MIPTSDNITVEHYKDISLFSGLYSLCRVTKLLLRELFFLMAFNSANKCCIKD